MPADRATEDQAMMTNEAAGAVWLNPDGVTLMSVVNLNADSFSDPRDGAVDLDERLAVARAAVAEGAGLIDVGAQSAALAAALVGGAAQRDVLVPVVAALASEGVAVSVDTYDPVAAAAVLDAGAAVLNDFSGAPTQPLIEAVSASDAMYVLTHNPVGPRVRQTDPAFYNDVVAETIEWLQRGLEQLSAWGLEPSRVIVDPGVDVGKTPAQTLELLRGRDQLREAFTQPLLWAISRKDVLGALTGRPPAQRDAATLGLLAAFAEMPGCIVRIHDTAACADLLMVQAALASRRGLNDALLDDALRREV
jgi:dihydropteroate synthase